MIGEPSCVCVMLLDPQVGFMVEQAVQDVGRVANSGIVSGAKADRPGLRETLSHLMTCV